jgi:hypothetical protein
VSHNSQNSLIGSFLNLAGKTGTRVKVADNTLDPARVAEFNTLVQSIAPGSPEFDADFIAAMMRQMQGDARAAGTASVQKRLDHADRLEAMAHDETWRLPEGDVERVDSVMNYIEKKDDLIPDSTPVVGMLDDAILIEMAERALQREIEDYADFCRFREAEARARGTTVAELGIDRRDWLSWRRMIAQRHAADPGRSYVGSDEGDGFRVG